MEHYPGTATERFDNANFHINYCLSFIKRYIHGNVLEIGAGCGSFTRNYCRPDLKKIVLTEKDPKNISDLNEKFHKDKNVRVLNASINNIEGLFDSILYLHVLEHIKDDLGEL